ncbi:MAG: hypothetical protein U0930_20655 [Pirellulales bacterium]
MSTHTAVYFEGVRVTKLEESIRAFFADNDPSKELTSSVSSSLPIYGDLFHFGKLPTAFSFAECPVGWCTAHFNCFSRLTDFANSYSLLLKNRVIVLNMQSTSCCYYIGVHESGTLRRAISVENGDCSLQHGEPFEFEAESRVDGRSRESAVIQYCHSLGLTITGQACHPPVWHHIRLVDQPASRTYTATTKSLPWWKWIFG